MNMEAIERGFDVVFHWLGVWVMMNAITKAGEHVAFWMEGRRMRKALTVLRELHVTSFRDGTDQDEEPEDGSTKQKPGAFDYERGDEIPREDTVAADGAEA